MIIVKWIYRGERKRLFGKWCYPGNIVTNHTKPPGKWELVGKETKTIDKDVGQVSESKGIEMIRTELLKKKMGELRIIGKPYGAADTKKSELVDEIIKAKITRGEL